MVNLFAIVSIIFITKSNADILLTTIHNSMKTCEMMNKETCDFDKNNNMCVLSIFYNGQNTSMNSICQKCPFQTENDISSVVCTRAQAESPSSQGKHYMCCCSSPFCVDTIRGDTEIWDRKGRSACIRADYDNSKLPYWTDKDTIEQDHVLWESSKREPLCHMKVKITEYEDYRSGAILPRVEILLGYGCPEQAEFEDRETVHKSYLVQYTNSTTYCCYGQRCNADLYRNIGFETIQNIVHSRYQYEYYSRITFELKNYGMRKNGTFVMSNHNFMNHEAWMMLVMILISVGFTLWKVKMVDIEKRPGSRIYVYEHRREDLDDFQFDD